MGFSEAVKVCSGDTVIRCGKPRRVWQVWEAGRNAPYYLISAYPGVLPSESEGLPAAPIGKVWVSWQTCG